MARNYLRRLEALEKAAAVRRQEEAAGPGFDLALFQAAHAAGMFADYERRELITLEQLRERWPERAARWDQVQETLAIYEEEIGDE